MKPAASSAAVLALIGVFGAKSVFSFVCCRGGPKPPGAPRPCCGPGNVAPGACFAAMPVSSYWPSMIAIVTRMTSPCGVRLRTVGIGCPPMSPV